MLQVAAINKEHSMSKSIQKLTLISLILVFSTPALADYFFCEIQTSYGYITAKNEAEYRVLQTSVEDTEFRCEGYIKNSTTYVKATSLNSGNIMLAEQNHSVAEVTITGLSNQGDFLKTVICRCGMN